MTASRKQRFPIARWMALACLLPAAAWAGLPQPSIHLSGQVRLGEQVLKSGTLVWKYRPLTGGGPTVEVRTELREFVGSDGTVLSYSALIPVERTVEKAADSIGTEAVGLQLSRTPVEYERTATLDGREMRILNSERGSRFLMNERAFIGSLEVVDLTVIGTRECCRGDSDLDNFVNVSDFLATTYWFGNGDYAYGDANCDFFTNVADYRTIREEFGRSCATAKSTVTRQKFQKEFDPTTNGNAELFLTAANDQVPRDKSIEVAVMLDVNSSEVSLLGVFVQFDAEQLAFESGTVSKAFEGDLFTGLPSEVSPGLVAFSAGNQAGLTESVEVARLRFRARAEGTSDIRVLQQGLTDTRALNKSRKDLTVTSQPFTLKVLPVDSNVPDWIMY